MKRFGRGAVIGFKEGKVPRIALMCDILLVNSPVMRNPG